jgi:small subunit ribosomal protein S16
MAVKIRLARMGTKKRPFYRIVVAHSEAPRDGRYVEQVGYYDPTEDPVVIKLDFVKIDQWLKRGAQPTQIVAQLIKKTGEASTASGSMGEGLQ